MECHYKGRLSTLSYPPWITTVSPTFLPLTTILQRIGCLTLRATLLYATTLSIRCYLHGALINFPLSFALQCCAVCQPNQRDPTPPQRIKPCLPNPTWDSCRLTAFSPSPPRHSTISFPPPHPIPVMPLANHTLWPGGCSSHLEPGSLLGADILCVCVILVHLAVEHQPLHPTYPELKIIVAKPVAVAAETRRTRGDTGGE